MPDDDARTDEEAGTDRAPDCDHPQLTLVQRFFRSGVAPIFIPSAPKPRTLRQASTSECLQIAKGMSGTEQIHVFGESGWLLRAGRDSLTWPH